MSSDSLHAVERLTDWSARVRKLQTKSTQLKAVRDQLLTEKASKESEVEKLGSDLEVLTKVGELFRVLMDRLVLSQVESLESVATEGLKAIFYDQDLGFCAEMGQKYNKVSVDLFLTSGNPEDGGIKEHPLKAFGGGPSSIASLILRVLTLLRMKRFPLLLLDETLAAVGEVYVEQTSKFLRKLAETSKIDILLVTHAPSFLDHANVAYQAEGYETGFSIRRIKESK